VKGNICYNNDHSGIHLYASSEGSLIGNTCAHNYNPNVTASPDYARLTGDSQGLYVYRGIWLSNSSNGNLVVENTCQDNGNGIELSDQSNENIISGNICPDNHRHGISLRGSSSNTLSGNISRNNSQLSPDHYDGINLQDGSTRNVIVRNDLSDTQYAATQRYGYSEESPDDDYNILVYNKASGNATGQANIRGIHDQTR